METDRTNHMDEDEQFELARWLIERYDNQRSAVANRASIILSANALLLTAALFLLDKALSGGVSYSQSELAFLAISIGADIVLLFTSMTYAVSAIAFVWRPIRDSVKSPNLPPLWFFQARETSKRFNKLDDFESEYKTTTKDQMIHYALGELLLITNAHFQRYQSFRKSIRLTLASLVPLAISIALLFTKLF